MDYANVKDNPTDVQQLHDALEAAVKRQLMSDVPYGVLLSGRFGFLHHLCYRQEIRGETHRDQWESGRMVASTPLRSPSD